MNEQVAPDYVLRMCVEVEALKAIFSLLRHRQFPDQGAAAALIYNPIYSKQIALPLRAVQSVCYTVSCWRRKRDLNPEMNVIVKNETLLFQEIIKIIIHFVCNFCLLISENMLIHLLQHIRRRMSHAFHCILVGYV